MLKFIEEEVPRRFLVHVYHVCLYICGGLQNVAYVSVFVLDTYIYFACGYIELLSIVLYVFVYLM